jgi:6-phosphogluconolactonase (cycloisomerase 2 family)
MISRKTRSLVSVFFLGLVTLVPVSGGQPQERSFPQLSDTGAVLAMTNAPSGNEVLMYRRAQDGTLTFIDRFATGGTGTSILRELCNMPDVLGSQGSLTLSEDNRWLFAANSSSHDVSVFRVEENRLTRVQRISSGGVFPVSITVRRNLVYVLNAGGEANLMGFTFRRGRLRPLDGSRRTLPEPPNSDPANTLFSASQIAFTPQGYALVVTVKGGSPQDSPGDFGRIHVFPLAPDGLPSAVPTTTPSAGNLPFGFAFDELGRLYISEIYGQSPDTRRERPGIGVSAVSSYTMTPDGGLEVISTSVPNFQTTACWALRLGPYLYTANPFAGTLSGYVIAPDGTLTLLDADGVSGAIPDPDAANPYTPFPADMALAQSRTGRFLYSLNTGASTISVFQIGEDGRLSLRQNVRASAHGIPVLRCERPNPPDCFGGGAQGLAAF